MTHTNLDAFAEWFYRDLEKWFSADIACCNLCRDDFLAMWPYADHADDHRFQVQSIDLDTFYSGSYLRQVYTKRQFERYIGQLECPRCGGALQGDISAYNLPFDVPADFERTVREVHELSRRTPFLLLENHFCQEVLKAIRELAVSTPPVAYPITLFRARSEEHGPIAEEIATFDFPPAGFVKEGRYNHAGQPALYLGSDSETCHAELRFCKARVVEFLLNRDLKTLDLLDSFGSHADHADLLNCLVYSALVSARQDDDGWHKPHYVVSRFVADCAKAAGFDAVKYPSTRRTSTNFNLVVLNPSLSLSLVATAPRFFALGGKNAA